MNAVAKVQETNVAPAIPSLMQVISQVAMNPDLDLDRLERLMGMKERMESKAAEQAYDAAMSAAQAEMGAVRTDASNTQTKSKYATYSALDAAIRPIYTKHGFSLSFYSGENAPEGHVRVVCKVAHRDGHSERPYVDMPADGKGAKGGDVMTKTHATGSAFSYGQRYLAKLIFNVAVAADDDGNAAGGPREMSEVARRAIEEINAAATAADLALWKKNKSEGVAGMISAAEHKEVVATYNRRAKAMKEKASNG